MCGVSNFKVIMKIFQNGYLIVMLQNLRGQNFNMLNFRVARKVSKKYWVQTAKLKFWDFGDQEKSMDGKNIWRVTYRQEMATFRTKTKTETVKFDDSVPVLYGINKKTIVWFVIYWRLLIWLDGPHHVCKGEIN